MKKSFLVYFFSFALMMSVLVPAYQCLFDSDNTISIMNINEEEERSNKEITETLVKIFYESNNAYFSETKNNVFIGYLPKDYSSFYKENTCPPPESYI